MGRISNEAVQLEFGIEFASPVNGFDRREAIVLLGQDGENKDRKIIVEAGDEIIEGANARRG